MESARLDISLFHCTQLSTGGQIKFKLLGEACNTSEIKVRGVEFLVMKLEEKYPFERSLCRQ